MIMRKMGLQMLTYKYLLEFDCLSYPIKLGFMNLSNLIENNRGARDARYLHEIIKCLP